MRAHRLAIPVAALLLVSNAVAYPEFQAWSQKNSQRFVNCAMCHAHPDGPDGIKPGQIGSLGPMEIEYLSKARNAFEPGTEVHSPILNDAGNAMVQKLGRREIISLRANPGALGDKLGNTIDTDSDGLSNSREYQEGTDPLDPASGNPTALLRINFSRQRFHIVMIILATGFALFGLNHLLRGLHRLASRPPLKR